VTTTPASTEELAAETWRLIMNLVLSWKQRIPQVASSLDLNPGAMNALLFLSADDPKPMGALAEAFRVDASHVTWLVDRLEEKGLAERLPHPTDRRVRVIAITKKGQRVRDEIEARLFEAPGELTALTRDELTQLQSVLRKIVPEHVHWA